jgi:hypothetical protein
LVEGGPIEIKINMYFIEFWWQVLWIFKIPKYGDILQSLINKM